MTEEIWKAIPGYEGSYEVSDQGRVRSLDRVVKHSNGFLAALKGRVLRARRGPKGYAVLRLGRGEPRYVHRLVLMAFVGPAPSGYECLHGAGGPSDNSLANLRWGTRLENHFERVRPGGWHKLSEADVKDIKRALQTPCRGLNMVLARQYGVSHLTISGIKRGVRHGRVSLA